MGLFDKFKTQAMNGVSEAVKSAAQSFGNKSVPIAVTSIPGSLQEFTALPQAAMATPFDTAAMTVIQRRGFRSDAQLSARSPSSERP